jgi:large conductance mechanosensitive channel
MSLLKEFKDFAAKGNVVDLAVAVVMGQAFGKIVSSVVSDIFMPIVGAILPGGDWREYTITPLNLKIGSVLGATLDFLVVALVLFIVVVKVIGGIQKRGTTPPPPTTKKCSECLEDIPLAAKRCRACTSPVS